MIDLGSIRRKKFLVALAAMAAIFVAQSVVSARHEIGAVFASGHGHDHASAIGCAESAVPHHHECCCDGQRGADSQRLLMVKRAQKRMHSDALLAVYGAWFDPEMPATDCAVPTVQVASMIRSDSHLDRGPPA